MRDRTALRICASVFFSAALGACDSPAPMTTSDAGPVDAAVEADAASPADTGPVDAGPLRADPTLPVATGTCPDFHTSGTITVAPAGATPRNAMIWVSDAAETMDGPLV